MKTKCIAVIILILIMTLALSGCSSAPSKLHGKWRSPSGNTLEFYRDWTTERCIMCDAGGSGVDFEVRISDKEIIFSMGHDTQMRVSYNVTSTRLCLEGDCYERMTKSGLTDGWIMQLEEWLGDIFD